MCRPSGKCIPLFNCTLFLCLTIYCCCWGSFVENVHDVVESVCPAASTHGG